jgi:hypothetical protein
MLRRLVALSVASVPFLAFGIGVSGAKPPPSPCALRAEGYGGMAVYDPQGNSSNPNAANAGGTGSVACLFAPFHFQGDVFGDYTDVDGLFTTFHADYLTNVGGGGHIGVADPTVGALEVNGAFNQLAAHDRRGNGNWRIGGEGEYYLDASTLGVQAGYLKMQSSALDKDVDADGDGFYARALLRFYPMETLKLEGTGGVSQIDGSVTPTFRGLVEYRPQTWPVGFFARWEGAFDNKIDQNFAVAGVRLYLFDSPATLRETDRRYFRDACVQTLAGARTC